MYRVSDRVSQFLVRDVAYRADPDPIDDRLFQIVAFRTFSNIQTWRSVVSFLGRPPIIRDLTSGRFLAALEHAKIANGRLYTGAFILCATDAYGKRVKHLNHVELFRHMFVKDNAGMRLANAKSLADLYRIIHEYPLMGDFMAYQIAIDLNYLAEFPFSENDFTQPGPGALRGIRKVFEDLGDYTPSEVILWMVDRQDREFRRLDLDFSGLWGRHLHAIDCQGLFCETDKYCREAAPELLSARKRIKTKFAPSAEPLEFFFPPKWGINTSMSRTVALSS